MCFLLYGLIEHTSVNAHIIPTPVAASSKAAREAALRSSRPMHALTGLDKHALGAFMKRFKSHYSIETILELSR
jgi:hypothetical protein